LSTFVSILNNISLENPHALILNGPFLSCDNTLLSTGNIKINENDENGLEYEEFFELIISKINLIFAVKYQI
jgi:hypothetical protein